MKILPSSRVDKSLDMESTRSSGASTNIYSKDGVTYQKSVILLPYNNHKTAPMNPFARLMDSFHILVPFL